MSLLSLFAFAVYAAGTVISPIPDDVPSITTPVQQPDISFGQIVDVLGVTNVVTPAPSPAFAPVTKKKSYTIAFLGDSMINTLGPELPSVGNKLSTLYPATRFTLLNYGVGATNIDDAIHRISSFASARPDIVVLESCAYNPYPDGGGIDRHRLALAEAVNTLRSSIPGVNIIIASTIAPNSRVFGDGAPGIAFSPEDKINRTSLIKQYLDSTVKFAASLHLPLADAYHASLTSNGDGLLTYINSGDHIHYSPAGREFFAQTVVRALETVL